MSAPPDPFNRRPWPMKWIIVAILACIIPYTWLTIAYRKEGPAHQPYQDNKDLAQVLRLLESGFNRFELSMTLLESPLYPSPGLAATEKLPGGLPPLLRDLLIDAPAIPPRVPMVAAPATSSAGAAYVFHFACAQAAEDEQPASAELYRRGSELVVIINHDADGESLQTRDINAVAEVNLPADTLEPGSYQITLLGERESRRWQLTLQ